MKTESLRIIWSATALLACVHMSAPVGAATDPYVGAITTGGAKVFSLICGTCPIDSTNFPDLVDGGPGHPSADIAHAEAGYSIAGDAALTGPLDLPTLGASASADILVDNTIPKTFFYAASVSSQGLQRYTYTGASQASYQVHYLIDGNFILDGVDAVPLMQVFGGINIYKDGYTPGAETNPSYGFDFKQASASAAGTQAFHLSGNVDFTLEPGAAFYVWALLGVNADSSHQVSGAVDALNTMTLSFTVGDTTLLSSELTAVPLPSPLWLLAPVVCGLGATRRRASVSVSMGAH